MRQKLNHVSLSSIGVVHSLFLHAGHLGPEGLCTCINSEDRGIESRRQLSFEADNHDARRKKMETKQIMCINNEAGYILEKHVNV